MNNTGMRQRVGANQKMRRAIGRKPKRKTALPKNTSVNPSQLT
jgi:hypothetical protein